MSKKIILCFDGTTNQPKDAEQGHTVWGGLEDDGITNVLKLHLLLGGDLRGGSRFDDQVSLYHSGVGTYGSKTRRVFNTVFSPENLDVGRIIRDGVADLTQHYQDGDEVFLVGFSRGAAIARRFAAVLPDHFPERTPRVRFMAVFDTVASIGKPNLNDEQKPVSDVVFENGRLSDCVDEALHMLALDERRKAFLPTLMNREDRVTEVWLPGAHADIGGGFREDGLSDLALQFLLDELDRRELSLKTMAPTEIDFDGIIPAHADFDIDVDDILLEPNVFGTLHMQKRLPLATRLTLTWREARVNVDDQASEHSPLVHWTAAERVYGDREYRPKALRRRVHDILHPDNSPEPFQGLHDHVQRGARRLKSLAVDDDHKATCRAHLHYNHTGVALEQGGRYVFSVPADQTWHDARIPCGPVGWSRDSVELGPKEFLIQVTEWKRRKPDANWFALVGCVGDSDEELFEILEHTERPYVPERSGELCTFANDLESRYGNNSGRMCFTVKRVG